MNSYRQTRIIVAGAILLSTGCKKAASTRPESEPVAELKAIPTLPPSDPVAELKALAAKLKNPPKDIVFSKPTIDVRKTDSLISPLVGTVSVTVFTLNHETQKPAWVQEMVISADYKDSEWVWVRSDIATTELATGNKRQSVEDPKNKGGWSSVYAIRTMMLKCEDE